MFYWLLSLFSFVGFLALRLRCPRICVLFLLLHLGFALHVGELWRLLSITYCFSLVGFGVWDFRIAYVGGLHLSSFSFCGFWACSCLARAVCLLATSLLLMLPICSLSCLSAF